MSATEQKIDLNQSFWTKWGGFWAVLRHLSLDVVLGSICMGWLAVFASESAPPLAWWFFLPLGVWLVYSLDHLVDAARIGPDAQTARHRFHAHYFDQIRRAVIYVAAITAVAAFVFLPIDLLLFGGVMFAASLLHVWLARRIGGRVRPWLTKELAVAFVYTVGIWGGPLLYATEPSSGVYLLLAAVFCLAAANLIFFARMEIVKDRRDGHSSLARALGVRVSDVLAAIFCLLPLLSLWLEGQLFTDGNARIWLACIVLQLMAAVMLVLIMAARNPYVKRNYRSWGDAIFCFPLLIPLGELLF